MAMQKKKQLTVKQLKKQVTKLQKKEETTRAKLRAALLRVNTLGKLLKNRITFDKTLSVALKRYKKSGSKKRG